MDAMKELFIAICEELGIDKLVRWLDARLPKESAHETYLKNGEEVAYIDLPDEVKAYFDTPGNILKKTDNAES